MSIREYALLCILLIVCNQQSVEAYYRSKKIPVNSQAEFSKLNSYLHYALKEGFSEIKVQFSSGVFYYDEEHIRLSGYNNSSLSISFVGDNTTLIAKGKNFMPTSKSDFELSYYGASESYGRTYLTHENELIDLDGEVMMSPSVVEVVDKSRKLCRILTHYDGQMTTGMKILITEWYKSGLYPVVKIKDKFVYFIANDLKISPTYHCYNVNLDFGFSKGACYPRYRLYNEASENKPYINNNIFVVQDTLSYVHECDVSRFFYASNLNLKSLSFQGLVFIGNKESSSLFQFKDINAEAVIIKGCTFKYLRNYIALINGSNSFIFENNLVDHCFFNGLLSDNRSKNTQVFRNRFVNNGARLNQHCCVDCRGENYHIHHNEFRNFSYSAINVGLYYQSEVVNPPCGIVEYNTVYYDNEYYNNYPKYTLMDSGAIYVTTQNQNAVIRCNVIHDYVGMCANRGIFCDTGTKNVEIYGNTIWNIPNSNAIELWNVKEPETLVGDANTGNRVYDNLIGGVYQFEAKKRGNNVHRKNYVIYPIGETKPKPVLKGLDSLEDDVFIEGYTAYDHVIILPKSSRKALRYSKALSNPELTIRFE